MCLPLGAGPHWFHCSSSWWLLLSRNSSRIWYEKHFHRFWFFYIVQRSPPHSGQLLSIFLRILLCPLIIRLTKYSFTRAVKYSRTNINVITLLKWSYNKSFELFYFCWCIFTWRQCRPDETICFGFCFSLFVLWGLSCSLQSTEEALMLMWEQQATLRRIDTSSSTP